MFKTLTRIRNRRFQTQRYEALDQVQNLIDAIRYANPHDQMQQIEMDRAQSILDATRQQNRLCPM